jgi:hypothetical protein
LEYLVNLEDEQINEDADNKQQIQRCKEFREMVYKDIINLLHDTQEIKCNLISGAHHKNNLSCFYWV